MLVVFEGLLGLIIVIEDLFDVIKDLLVFIELLFLEEILIDMVEDLFDVNLEDVFDL